MHGPCECGRQPTGVPLAWREAREVDGVLGQWVEVLRVEPTEMYRVVEVDSGDTISAVWRVRTFTDKVLTERFVSTSPGVPGRVYTPPSGAVVECRVQLAHPGTTVDPWTGESRPGSAAVKARAYESDGTLDIYPERAATPPDIIASGGRTITGLEIVTIPASPGLYEVERLFITTDAPNTSLTVTDASGSNFPSLGSLVLPKGTPLFVGVGLVLTINPIEPSVVYTAGVHLRRIGGGFINQSAAFP